jgi:hypothetical protein
MQPWFDKRARVDVSPFRAGTGTVMQSGSSFGFVLVISQFFELARVHWKAVGVRCGGDTSLHTSETRVAPHR